MADIFEQIGQIGSGLSDAFTGLVEGVDDALKDLGDQLLNAGAEALTNLITSADDILKDMLQFIYDLPKAVVDGLTKMFKDPKFWQMVLISLALVTFASGLSAATAAPAGMKGAAFMKGAGLIYNGWHLDFAVKLHRLTYLVSPQYRENFIAVLGDLPQRLNDAGIDIQYASALFGSVLSLVDSFGAIMGRDWNVTQAGWNEQLLEIGSVTGETLEEWGKDPEKMIDWFDENVIAPAHNQAAGFINTLSTGLSNVVAKTDDFVGKVQDIRKGFQRVATDYDELYGTEYAQLLKDELIGFDEVIFEEWKTIRETLETASEIMEVKIAEVKGSTARSFRAINAIDLSKRDHNKKLSSNIYNMGARLVREGEIE